jgi:hypothetical protein
MLFDFIAGELFHVAGSEQIHSDRKRTLLASRPTAQGYDASPFTNEKFLGSKLISMRGWGPGINHDCITNENPYDLVDNENNSSSLLSFYHSKE